MDARSKAVIAGTKMVIALMEKQTPAFTEGWKSADDSEVGWPNHYLQEKLLAFSHPDSTVVRKVQTIAAALGVTGNGFPPNLDFDFLYINKM